MKAKELLTACFVLFTALLETNRALFDGKGIALSFHPRESRVPVLADRDKLAGLGLPISREIVEHHGGRLTARSRVDVGSVFRMTLPLAV